MWSFNFQLFVHDFKTVKRDGMLIDVVKSCPRQVLPFAVLNLQAIDVSPRRTGSADLLMMLLHEKVFKLLQMRNNIGKNLVFMVCFVK